ncbi:hypothetical protein [Asanoa sp. NPDC050611]|uniref:hypothetical protein n=1 Tax=Asanoa sp. NPDC050611 TaxID=3157098 RepID=UPI003402038B
MTRWYGVLADWVRARSRRERLGLAAAPVVLVLAVVVAVLVAGGGDGEGRWQAGSGAAAPADESAADSGVGTKPHEAGADEPDPTGPTGAPPPLVQPFAEQPKAKPNPPLPSPTAGLEIAEGTDGCDHAYGDRSICVPWVFPDGISDKCAWLRERGFGALPVTGGRDRHGLDRNGDGTACGSGD